MKSFSEFLVEGTEDVPVCVGTEYNEIIIKYPNSETRYYYNLKYPDVAEKYRKLCQKYGAGKYIQMFKDHCPMRKVTP